VLGLQAGEVGGLAEEVGAEGAEGVGEVFALGCVALGGLLVCLISGEVRGLVRGREKGRKNARLVVKLSHSPPP
jgi:hypothetical protein